jgi:hypothetical protein
VIPVDVVVVVVVLELDAGIGELLYPRSVIFFRNGTESGLAT